MHQISGTQMNSEGSRGATLDLLPACLYGFGARGNDQYPVRSPVISRRQHPRSHPAPSTGTMETAAMAYHQLIKFLEYLISGIGITAVLAIPLCPLVAWILFTFFF
ncbi:MAG: hypothetical protein ACR2OW_16600 [Methyloligellaceae bacterium]